MDPHPAYTAADMPARKLEAIVKHALKGGAGVEPVAIAEALFKVASSGEKIPLHLALGDVALKLIKSKFDTRLQNLEAYKHIGAIGS